MFKGADEICDILNNNRYKTVTPTFIVLLMGIEIPPSGRDDMLQVEK
jgi:hypothetical protein